MADDSIKAMEIIVFSGEVLDSVTLVKLFKSSTDKLRFIRNLVSYADAGYLFDVFGKTFDALLPDLTQEELAFVSARLKNAPNCVRILSRRAQEATGCSPLTDSDLDVAVSALLKSDADPLLVEGCNERLAALAKYFKKLYAPTEVLVP
jgi:hypothetical protein